MHSLGVPEFSLPHPVIKRSEDFAGNSNTEVISPTSDDRVEMFCHHFDILASKQQPFVSQFFPYLLYRFLAWLDKQFPTGLCSLVGFVMSDLESKKVEAFSQVNDFGLKCSPMSK